MDARIREVVEAAAGLEVRTVRKSRAAMPSRPAAIASQCQERSSSNRPDLRGAAVVLGSRARLPREAARPALESFRVPAGDCSARGEGSILLSC